MSTFSNSEAWEFTKAASGTVTLPTNYNFTNVDDYDVVVIEGEGSLDAASKGLTSFDVTVTAGPLKGRVFPRNIGAIAQVS